jgi:hypothetical protein
MRLKIGEVDNPEETSNIKIINKNPIDTTNTLTVTI